MEGALVAAAQLGLAARGAVDEPTAKDTPHDVCGLVTADAQPSTSCRVRLSLR